MQLLKHIPSKFFALADQALVSGSNFVLGVLLARFLGIEQYGLFAILWLAVLFALSLHQASITKPMLSFLPKKTGKEKQEYIQGLHLSQCLLTVLILFLAFAEWGLQCSQYFWQGQSQNIPMIIAIAALFVHHDFYRKLGFAQSAFLGVLCLDILLFGLPLIAVVVLFLLEMLSLESALLSILCFNSVSVLTGLVLYKLPPFKTAALKQVFRIHYDFSKWLFGTAILQWFSGNFFILSGAGLLGAVAVGAVRICQNIMGLSHVLFLLMENIIPVEAAKIYHQDGQQKAMSYLQKTALQLGLPFLAGMLLLAFSAPYLIEFVYGSTYVPYSYIIPVFCGMYCFVFLGNPLRFALRTLDNTKPIFIAYCVSTAFSMAAAVPFLQWWHLDGLLAGLVITQILTTLVYIFYLKQYLFKPTHIAPT